MAQHILVFCIRVYRWTLSPAQKFLFGPYSGCRYSPSCSVFALEAVERHGALRGAWLALKRLARCHPWGGCGEDPVPEQFQFNTMAFSGRSKSRASSCAATLKRAEPISFRSKTIHGS